jgi:ABC-type arginine/histidine transport system permease subunit
METKEIKEKVVVGATEGVEKGKVIAGKAMVEGKSLFKKLCLYLLPLALKFLADNRAEVIAELKANAEKTNRKLDDLAVIGLDKLLESYASKAD